MSSLFLIKGQWGSDVPGLEPSEGGQPQMLPDSKLDRLQENPPGLV